MNIRKVEAVLSFISEYLHTLAASSRGRNRGGWERIAAFRAVVEALGVPRETPSYTARKVLIYRPINLNVRFICTRCIFEEVRLWQNSIR
jgi:hypothetical protein